MEETIFTFIIDNLDRFLHSTVEWLGAHLFNIIVIIFLAWLASRYGGPLLSRLFHRTIRADLYPSKSDRIKRIETIESLTQAILKVVIFVMAVAMVVSEIGIDTTPLIASAGVLGVALGFGAQSLIKDFTSGMFIIIDNQYRVGDYVKLNDIGGTVEAITIRTTVLRGLDGTQYHIPNGSITTTANVTMNFSGFEENIVFDHDIDIEKLILTLNRVGTDMAKDPTWASFIKEPPRFARIVGFDLNGIKVKVLGRTTANESWDVKSEFYKRLVPALRKANIHSPINKIKIAKTVR